MANTFQYPEVISLCFCNIVTIIGCIWMWNRSRTLDPELSRRLFPRQFKHLAVSDLLAAVGALLNMLMEYTTFPTLLVPFWGRVFCDIGLSIYGAGINGTILAIGHIALSFVCAHFRWTRCLRLLGRALVLCIWLGGSAIAVTSVLVYSRFDNDRNICVCTSTAYIETIFIVATFAFVLLTYSILVVGMLTRRKSPHIVQSKVWKRALIYPCIFFFTNGLMTALFWAPKVFQSCRVLFAVTLCMQGLNGVLNVGAYWLNSKHREGTQHVQGDAESMTEDLLGVMSFHVVFASEDEEIPPVTSHGFSISSTSDALLTVDTGEAHATIKS